MGGRVAAGAAQPPRLALIPITPHFLSASFSKAQTLHGAHGKRGVETAGQG